MLLGVNTPCYLATHHENAVAWACFGHPHVLQLGFTLGRSDGLLLLPLQIWSFRSYSAANVSARPAYSTAGLLYGKWIGRRANRLEHLCPVYSLSWFQNRLFPHISGFYSTIITMGKVGSPEGSRCQRLGNFSGGISFTENCPGTTKPWRKRVRLKANGRCGCSTEKWLASSSQGFSTDAVAVCLHLAITVELPLPLSPPRIVTTWAED